MVTGFVDTTILVDILRGYPPAGPWLKQQPPLAMTPIVWMELVEGAQNKADQREIVNAVIRFEMVYLTQEDMDWAMQHLMAHKLSHNIGMMDCLIASVCHRLQKPLYTHNLKHMQPLLGNLAQQPY